MSDKKLKRLRSYVDSLQNTASMFELDDEELDMVNAAGVFEQRKNSRPIKHP